ncbi:hypothetical protein ES703_100940 [subsurface metagenome]
MGILASNELKDSVKHFQAIFAIGLKNDPSEVRVVTSIVRSPDSEETCFMIDSDYYDLKKIKTDELLTRLDFFHSKAYRLFRWCITEKLHKAMKPHKVTKPKE